MRYVCSRDFSILSLMLVMMGCRVQILSAPLPESQAVSQNPVQIASTLTPAKRIKALAGVYTGNCALIEDGVYCWGTNVVDNSIFSLKPVVVPGFGTGVVQLEGFYNTLCALKSDGAAWCWGENYDGKFGNGTTDPSPVPVRVAFKDSNGNDLDPQPKVLSIKPGYADVCALVADGSLWCWGANRGNELLNGDPGVMYPSPVKLPPFKDSNNQEVAIKDFAVGNDGEACALLANDDLQCWGSSWSSFGDGQMADGTPLNAPVSVLRAPAQAGALPSGITSFGIGDDGTKCAVAGGGVWCWGDGSGLGNNDPDHNVQPVPTPVYGLSSGVKSVVMGDNNPCAIMLDGTVRCWGNSWNLSQLGDGTGNSSTDIPVQVLNLSNVTVIGNHDRSTCAVDNNQIYCWGDNGNGQLGVGGIDSSFVPVTFTEPAIAIVSGNNQSGHASLALALPLVVELRDEAGNILAGHKVNWIVTDGGGAVSNCSDSSDALGRIQCTWTLGSVGMNRVVASVPVSTHSVTFEANAAFMLKASLASVAGLSAVNTGEGVCSGTPVVVTNLGPVSTSEISIAAPAGFATQGCADTCTGATLVPNATCSFDVKIAKVSSAGALSGVLTVSAVSGGSFEINASGVVTDGCTGDVTQLAAGTACPAQGGIYVGQRNGYNIMITPGNCTNSPTPTCDGGTDTLSLALGLSGTIVGASDYEYGGLNTALLAAQGSPAASYCKNLNYGGYTDWYLPAINELRDIKQSYVAIGGFVADYTMASFYNSSTEFAPYDNSNLAEQVRPDLQWNSGSIAKTDAYLVRCVRRY